ncbi:dihydrofolate reductase family protein [Flagellimonas algicola]|uniref:Dihydrofolate reductase n=1 Tax=Flagellimonas algicola TaxID=2583815 RepID=A0ABY2WL33_9FLAO|nr:dihydrofolate reductase family protein [Allomuricauda algicola]TMU55557.1 dihydrofolate reductase [Allomuricauda algicola]
MRKLKLQMQVSLDGFNSTGLNDEQQWVTWAWDEIKQYVLEIANSADTEIIGRKLAVDYIPYWLHTLTKPNDPMYELAKIKAKQKKIVFSRTLKKLELENTILEKGNLREQVTKMKNQNGKDIVVYGGSSFVSNLIEESLIDEFHLFVNPIALGRGIPIFNKLDDWQQFKLIRSISFKSGIVLLHYKTK